jgi:hypothetical protein
MEKGMNIQQFQCPACNAPLNPKGAALIISCAYCHTSVIVPEELRQSSGAAGWATHLYDSFATNENRWLVGSFPSDYFAGWINLLQTAVTVGRPRSLSPRH